MRWQEILQINISTTRTLLILGTAYFNHILIQDHTLTLSYITVATWSRNLMRAWFIRMEGFTVNRTMYERVKKSFEVILMYDLAGHYINEYCNYADPNYIIRVRVVDIQRKPNNRELASPCQLICKIIHVSRERLVPYYRVFSVFICEISFQIIH